MSSFCRNFVPRCASIPSSLERNGEVFRSTNISAKRSKNFHSIERSLSIPCKINSWLKGRIIENTRGPVSSSVFVRGNACFRRSIICEE